MPYEIIIKETKHVRTLTNGPWVIVEKRPWTDKELAEKSSYYKGELDILKAEPLKEIMGYAPNREVMDKRETEILKQTVEDLDLAAVIKAINKL